MDARPWTVVVCLVGLLSASAGSCADTDSKPSEADGGGEGGDTSGAAGADSGGGAFGGAHADAGEGGAPEGGAGRGGITRRFFREYASDQAATLHVSAGDGLLSNADGWTKVRSFTRDTSVPSDAATLLVDSVDGSFIFEPAREFFGTYRAQYVLENAAHDTAAGDLSVTVRPVSVDLASVDRGAGGFTVTGRTPEGIGRAVSGAGDVDGDGYDDFLVGAAYAAGGAGRVYVVFGAPEHVSFEFDPTPPSGTRLAVMNGSGSEALGTSVSGAGDLDGDGFGDIVLGAPGRTAAADGRAYVVFGRERSALSGAIRDVVEARGFMLTRSGSQNVGTVVAGGGDFTGDDIPDLAIVAGQSCTLYLVDGSNDGDVDLEQGSERELRGTTNDRASWCAVAPLGDANGDGAGEMLVGSGLVAALLAGPASEYPDTLDSTAFLPEHGVLFEHDPPHGFVSASSAGDFDGDGVRDGIVCHERNGPSDRCRLFLGMPASAREGLSVTGFGNGYVRAAGGGDTSGDGISDLLFAETGTGASRGWVLFGRADPSALVNVRDPGSRGYPIQGGEVIESVALGGDIDGPSRDGSRTADWLVGDTAAASGNGRVTVLFGGKYSR